MKVNLRGNEIKRQEEVKYLGVIIGDELNWKSQVGSVRRKSLAGLAMIRRVSSYLPIQRIGYLDYCSASTTHVSMA